MVPNNNIYNIAYISQVGLLVKNVIESNVTAGSSIDFTSRRSSQHTTMARAIYCKMMCSIYPTVSLNFIGDVIKCKRMPMIVYYKKYADDKISYNDEVFVSLYNSVIDSIVSLSQTVVVYAGTKQQLSVFNQTKAGVTGKQAAENACAEQA